MPKQSDQITRLSKVIREFVEKEKDYALPQFVADLVLIAGVYSVGENMCCHDFAQISHDAYHQAEEQVEHAKKAVEPHVH